MASFLSHCPIVVSLSPIVWSVLTYTTGQVIEFLCQLILLVDYHRWKSLDKICSSCGAEFSDWTMSMIADRLVDFAADVENRKIRDFHSRQVRCTAWYKPTRLHMPTVPLNKLEQVEDKWHPLWNEIDSDDGTHNATKVLFMSRRFSTRHFEKNELVQWMIFIYLI